MKIKRSRTRVFGTFSSAIICIENLIKNTSHWTAELADKNYTRDFVAL